MIDAEIVAKIKEEHDHRARRAYRARLVGTRYESRAAEAEYAEGWDYALNWVLTLLDPQPQLPESEYVSPESLGISTLQPGWLDEYKRRLGRDYWRQLGQTDASSDVLTRDGKPCR